MTLSVGSFDLDSTNGCSYWEIKYGDPITGVPEVSGRRVLIPGLEGFYTPPTAPFENRRLVIGMKGHIAGEGSDHATIATSFATRFASLRAACDVAGREDVTITTSTHTITAGFLRFEHPPLPTLGAEGMDLLIEFEATDPPEWSPVGS